MDFLKCGKSAGTGTANMTDKQRQIELGSFQPGETEEMLHAKDYFKHGKLDKDGLVNFIKDVKKNTKLSDEDAAILAASKMNDRLKEGFAGFLAPVTDDGKKVYDAINEN